MKLVIRSATDADRDFAYQVKKDALGAYVAETWGWDEEFQRNFHATDWEKRRPDIIEFEHRAVGTLEVVEHPDHLYVGEFYVLPMFQKRGMGTQLLNEITAWADRQRVPIRLQFLKVNPVRSLYARHGFQVVSESPTHFFAERPAMTRARTPAESLRDQLKLAPLRTQRLTLRLPTMQDAERIYSGYAYDVEAIRWMGFAPHTSVSVTEDVVMEWIGNWRRASGALVFMIEDSTSGVFRGVVDVNTDEHGAAIGYILCRHSWGQGFATEAARCVVDLAFEHFGVWRTWATCAPENTASRHVLEKIGMKHEGVLKRWIVSPVVSPKPRDSDCLAITRDDWLAARS